MLDQIIKVFKKNYQVLNKIEISKSRLINNYKFLSLLNKKFQITPVLKSNAYGHGIKEVGAILDKVEAPFFCVDSLYEAYQLHKPAPFFKKVKTPILIMGYTDPSNLSLKRLPFQYAVWDLEFAKVLNEYQKGAKIHIFVDTGMHREGVSLEDLPNFLGEIKNLTNVEVIGLMSHLASCISHKDPLFNKQLNNFKEAKEIVKRSGLKIHWFHISASDPLIAPKQMKQLQPVLQFKTKIIQIKDIKRGECIGYAGTYKATRNIKVGVLPAGYNDGIDRRLSNKGVVLINGVRCPILGRVSMNITSVDISNVDNPFISQEVIIYSNNPDDPNSIDKVASLCDTIAHEILIRETPTTRRVVAD